MIYIQIFFFILTNLPEALSAIRKIIQWFKGCGSQGKQEAKMFYSDLKTAKKQVSADPKENIKKVVDCQLNKCA